MDPLSDVLSLLKPRSYMFRGVDFAGQWSFLFSASEGIGCYALQSGQCWLTVEGEDDAILLQAGDCVLIARRQSFRLASNLMLTPDDAAAFFSQARQGGIASINGGGELTGVGGYFDFAGKHAGILLSLLPTVVHIRKESDKAALRWSIEMMIQELREPQPGASLVAQDLGHMMLVLALRLHMAEAHRGGVGWFFALADRQLGAAINAMHADPARRWTLQSLAEHACMSRSAFALKFREVVGEPPMEYLVRWRMLLAGDKLLNSHASIAVIACSVGYESDSAFSAAFRRVMGCSPREYAKLHDPGFASIDEGPAAAILLESIPN